MHIFDVSFAQDVTTGAPQMILTPADGVPTTHERLVTRAQRNRSRCERQQFTATYVATIASFRLSNDLVHQISVDLVSYRWRRHRGQHEKD